MVANEDFKVFKNNLKVNGRQERKSPLIWITNEQNYEDKEKGEEFASGSAQIFALCRFILPKFKKGVCLSRRFRAQPESGDAACRVRQLCRRLVIDKHTPQCQILNNSLFLRQLCLYKLLHYDII